MFDKSNDVALLKTRIKVLNQRKQRLQAALSVEGSDHYFTHSELNRIEFQLQEANQDLARETDAQ